MQAGVEVGQDGQLVGDSLIEAKSGRSWTSADDSLKFVLKIEKGVHADATFLWFKTRGTAMALLPLGSPGEEAVRATSASVETLDSGNVRLYGYVEPCDAQLVRDRWFKEPGKELVVAALKSDHQLEREQQRQPPEPERGKGGVRGALAARWCAEDAFQLWLEQRFVKTTALARARLAGRKVTGDPGAALAAETLRLVCEIRSRADLDNDPEAWGRFDRRIRQLWMVAREAAEQGA
jgi:hypothetical protein